MLGCYRLGSQSVTLFRVDHAWFAGYPEAIARGLARNGLIGNRKTDRYSGEPSHFSQADFWTTSKSVLDVSTG